MNSLVNLQWKADPEAKLSIALAIYSSMISLAQELRGTTERLTIGGGGLILLCDGWFLSKQPPPSVRERVFLSLALVIFGFLLFMVVRTIHLRYTGVAYVIRRVNEIQMAHESSAFLEGESLFPSQWKEFGTETWNEPIFRLAYFAIGLIVLFATSALWIF